MSSENWIDKISRYKKLIAGTWIREDKEYSYEFSPLFNLSVSADLKMREIAKNKIICIKYHLLPQPQISPKREDGVPVDNPLLVFETGTRNDEFEIKVISEGMLIIFKKGQPEKEEILMKVPS